MPVARVIRWGVVCGLVVLAGCSGRQSRLAAPGVAKDAPKAAIAQYDTDGDGAIGGAELDQVPALKASLKRADQDGDDKISEAEIAARIAAWKRSGLALTRLAITVQRGGQPVPGAEVKLIPEEFLGPNVKPASGITDEAGVAHMKISDDPDESGVHLGYYRIEITSTASGGKAIPASNNTATQHGVEIAPDDANMGGFTVKLLEK